MKANLTILLLFGVCSIEAADRAKLAANQALRVDAPVAAFATVGAAQIRPIVGLPGLLRWSEPLALTESFARLSIAPGEQYAIGVSARRELVFLRLDASQSAVIARLSTELDSVDQILFSPSGASVAVRSAAGQVALVTSLPASPKIADTWSGVRNFLALSDDGELSLVDDGAILVLGGLIEERFETSKQQVPLLGDLPLIGGLFRSESRKRVRTNQIVFLRPIVLRDADSANRLSVDRYDQMRGEQKVMQPPPSMVLPVNQSPVLPPQSQPPKPIPPFGPNTPREVAP